MKRAVVALFALMLGREFIHLQAQNPAASLAQDSPFSEVVRPFLAKNCYGCHSAKLSAASLNLETYRDRQSAAKHPQVWAKVLDKIRSGQMPPPGLPRPEIEDLARVTEWLHGLLQSSGEAGETITPGSPGRVTARRLNRVEYNNTIRDLLGVPGRFSDEFPVDDSGYGFDNIGDVLTLSPMLMDKYFLAAERISRLAIYGETLLSKPTRLARLLNRRSPDVNDVVQSERYFPYSMRGAMYGTWVFPVDAEYEFRLRIANFRSQDDRLTPEQRAQQAEEKRKRAEALRHSGARPGRPEPTPEERRAREEAARLAAPPRKLVLTVGFTSVISEVIEGTTEFGYSRGEFTARVPVKAGEHPFRASFPELADLDDPRQNINPDMRRALFVDYLEIIGPFNPSPSPPSSYSKVFVCGHSPGSHGEACARKSIHNLLRRAYRRPVSRDEIESKLRLVKMAQQEGDTLEEGVRLALEAILLSPHFLFRIEQDRTTPGGAAQVSEHELASRLSYFLWSSMPDDALLALADQGELSKPLNLEAQVRRMLADSRSKNLVDNFAAQWLQLRDLGRTKPDPARFPTVDDELLDAMRTETSLFLQAIVQEDRRILDLIDAPFTFLNGPLAKHYGISGISGEAFQRVDLNGEQRSGLLTQASILTVSSYPTRTSPPVRGKWVLENLLGTPPPPPPPDVPVLDESQLGTAASMRERLEQHRKDPSCSPCHDLMDPIGFGLESYDAVGTWRTHEAGVAIDTSGILPDGNSFRGAKDLKVILRKQSDAFSRSLTEKLLTFALGRGLEAFDRPTVDAIAREVTESGHRFSALVLAIVNSKPFQMRINEGGA